MGMTMTQKILAKNILRKKEPVRAIESIEQ